ncbi:MAG: hypothetical protein KatS3mg115_0403 [Candidatus Poribacteria bacterium]|nr:MAG: hypothetical protein KatS3mg115_0403 [Candidatus Poribacteria bacterium]
MATWVPLVRDLAIIVLGLGAMVVGLVMLPGGAPAAARAQPVGGLDGRGGRAAPGAVQTGGRVAPFGAGAHRCAERNPPPEHLVPTVIHVERASADLSRTAQRAAQIVEEGYQVTHETVERVRHYRDRVFRPVIELASLWYGMRAVLRAVPLKRLVRRRKRTKRNASVKKERPEEIGCFITHREEVPWQTRLGTDRFSARRCLAF